MNRKNYLLLTFFTIVMLFDLGFSGVTYAQNVGINNPTPHAKALLDLTSSDKGLLAPRMTEAQRLAMYPLADATSEGMLVYQTDNTEGFYYYNGSQWILISTEKAGWSTTGNSGTTPATHFLGTTDNQGLSIRTNNTEKVNILPNGNVGIGVTNPAVKLEVRDSTWFIPMRIRNMLNNGYSVTQYLSNTGAASGHIGQVNPGALLHSGNFIVGSITSTPVSITSSDIERIRVNPDGSVGIGAVTTGSHVEIKKNSSTGYGQLQLTEPEQDYSRMVFRNTPNTKWWEVAAMPHPTDSVMALNFYHSINGDLMTIKGNGRVGIGTFNPKSRLNVANGSSGITPNPSSVATIESNGPAFFNVLSQNESGILFGTGTDAQNGGVIYNVNGIPNSMWFRTGGNVGRMAINSQGDVTISDNASWAGYRFSIYASEANLSLMAMLNLDATGLSGTAFHQSGGAQAAISGWANTSYTIAPNTFVNGTTGNFASTFITNSVERMRITETGNIGIGTPSPVTKLHVLDAGPGVMARFEGTNNAGYSIAHWIRSDGLGAHVGFFNPGLGGPLAGNFVMGTFGNAPVTITSNNAERIRITPTGEVGINTTAPTAELEVNGYTKLGTDAPAVKMKKLTGTTSSSQGTSVSLNHGLNANKILSISVLVDYSAGNCVPPSYTAAANFEYNYYLNGTAVSIINILGNSSLILGKPVRVLITYEE